MPLPSIVTVSDLDNAIARYKSMEPALRQRALGLMQSRLRAFAASGLIAAHAVAGYQRSIKDLQWINRGSSNLEATSTPSSTANGCEADDQPVSTEKAAGEEPATASTSGTTSPSLASLPKGDPLSSTTSPGESSNGAGVPSPTKASRSASKRTKAASSSQE